MGRLYKLVVRNRSQASEKDERTVKDWCCGRVSGESCHACADSGAFRRGKSRSPGHDEVSKDHREQGIDHLHVLQLRDDPERGMS